MVRILVVVKDRDTVKRACKHLEANYFDVSYADNAKEALELVAAGKADMLLCDADLPEAEILGRNRLGGITFPILFITDESGKALSEVGFRLGTDDLIVNPFTPDELVHRVTADAIRAKFTLPDTLVIGNFTMNLDEHAAYYNGEQMPFSVREFDILYKLLSNPKKTFTRSQLMASFWSSETTTGARTIDVYMAKIREKIAKCEEFEIVTMHGLGYKAIVHVLQ